MNVVFAVTMLVVTVLLIAGLMSWRNVQKRGS